MGIPKHLAAEQLDMLLHLALGIQAPTRIVQVNMVLGIQARIFCGVKTIKGLGRVECWVLLPEFGQSYFLGREVRSLCINHERAPSRECGSPAYNTVEPRKRISLRVLHALA